jgi:hypothetical protein
MRLIINEAYLDDRAIAWLRSLSPARRAVLFQAFWECEVEAGEADAARAHEDEDAARSARFEHGKNGVSQ